MEKSNYHQLQIELLTQEIKNVRSSIAILENQLHKLQEQHAWHVLVKAGRIPCRSNIEEISTLKKEERVKRESMGLWSKNVKGVPRKFKGDKTTKTEKKFKPLSLGEWLANGQASEKGV